MSTVLTSPLALYNQDNTIFDNVELPNMPVDAYGYDGLIRENAENINRVYAFDRENFIKYLLFQTAEMSLVYPDLETFRLSVTLWAKMRVKIWQQLYNTMFFKYNPIWNKDGTIKVDHSELPGVLESIADNTNISRPQMTESYVRPTEQLSKAGGRTVTTTDTRQRIEQHSGTDARTMTTNESETESYDNHATTHQITQDDTTGSVAAYDSSTLVNRDKTAHVLTETTTPTGSKTVQKTTAGGGNTDNLQHGEQITEGYQPGGQLQEHETIDAGTTETRSYIGTEQKVTSYDNVEQTTNQRTIQRTGTDRSTDERTEYGNIGVTMTQEMIQKERNLIQFDIYEYILNDFKSNFCLLIY